MVCSGGEAGRGQRTAGAVAEGTRQAERGDESEGAEGEGGEEEEGEGEAEERDYGEGQYILCLVFLRSKAVNNAQKVITSHRHMRGINIGGANRAQSTLGRSL